MFYVPFMQQRSAIKLSMLGIGAALGGWAWARRRAAPYELRGRVAWVSGGSRGLGLEIARVLVGQGARVVITARYVAELEQARSELAALGGHVHALLCDVTHEHDVEQCVTEIIQTYGRLDMLFNVAGVIQVSPLPHLTDADYDAALACHFWGPLRTMRAVLPVMRTAGQGRIINITSIGGILAVPHMAAYCASKFALVGLSDAFRAELAPAGIKVTTVCPGMMRTGSHIKATFKGKHRDEYKWFALSNAIPGLSINAARAARAIVRAGAAGRARLDLTLPTRAARIGQGLAPGAVAAACAMAARLLPKPSNDPTAEQTVAGAQARDARFDWLTALSDAASRRNNEIQLAPDPPPPKPLAHSDLN